MSQLNSPDDWHDLLAGYVLGDLSSDEVRQVHHYLTQHPEMQAEVQRLQTTLAFLPLSLPDPPAADQVRSRLLATTEDRLASRPDRPFPWRRAAWGIAGSAAALLVGGLGISAYRLQTELTAAKQEIARLQQTQQAMTAMKADMSRYEQTIALLGQPHNRLLTLQGMTDRTASGSLVIAPQQKAAVLTLQNLTAPKTGMVYRLWATMEGKKVYCAEFMPGNDGKVLIQVPVDRWEDTTSVMITVEPAQAEPQPSSDRVMMGSQSI